MLERVIHLYEIAEDGAVSWEEALDFSQETASEIASAMFAMAGHIIVFGLIGLAGALVARASTGGAGDGNSS